MRAALLILLQALTPWTPKQPCPNGCEFRSRDAREIAAHVWLDHAGDAS